MGGSGNKCSYAKCELSKRRRGLSFFTFPIKDESRCQIWQKNCGNIKIQQMDYWDLKEKILCERHFAIKYIYRSGPRKLLRRDAIPEKFTKPESEKEENDSTFIIPISPIETEYKEIPIDDPVFSTSGIRKTYPGKRTSIDGSVLSTSCNIPEKRQRTIELTDTVTDPLSDTVIEMPTNVESILREKCKQLELEVERLRKKIKSKNWQDIPVKTYSIS